jgi:hypothetical protein
VQVQSVLAADDPVAQEVAARERGTVVTRGPKGRSLRGCQHHPAVVIQE